MTGQELHGYCEEWRRWVDTRSFYVMPAQKNVLARMQPHRVREVPDALLSPEMSYFNLAIHALVEEGDPDAECFVSYYYRRDKNVKVVAHQMGIGRRTYYERRDRFARKALTLSTTLRSALGILGKRSHEIVFE